MTQQRPEFKIGDIVREYGRNTVFMITDHKDVTPPHRRVPGYSPHMRHFGIRIGRINGTVLNGATESQLSMSMVPISLYISTERKNLDSLEKLVEEARADRDLILKTAENFRK